MITRLQRFEVDSPHRSQSVTTLPWSSSIPSSRAFWKPEDQAWKTVFVTDSTLLFGSCKVWERIPPVVVVVTLRLTAAGPCTLPAGDPPPPPVQDH